MPWADSLPVNRVLKPLKYEVAINRHVLIEATVPDTPISYIDISTVNGDGKIGSPERLTFGTAPSRARRLPSTGDTIVSTVRTYLGAIAFLDPVEVGTVCSTGFAVVSPGPRLDPKFLFYWLRSDLLVDEVCARSVGISYPAINALEIGNLPVPLLPVVVQRRIACFLDRKTAVIDRLIAKQERLIELLLEKKQVIAAQAVTKGLDPSVPAKDSGIAWLEPIPIQWTTKRGRFLFRELSLPPLADDAVVTAFRDGEVTLRDNRRSDGFMLAEKEVGYQHVRQGDLVIHSMDAFAGAIGVSDSHGKCTPEYVVLEPRVARLNNRYYALLLRVMAKRNYIYVICPSVRERAPRFRFATFKDVLLPVPPPDEQDRITAIVQEKVKKLDKTISASQRLVRRLREYRQAVITAAVTGKIETPSEEAA